MCCATISHNFQDKKQQTVVNNDSGQIMEMLNSAFDELCPQPTCPDLFPGHLQEEINQLNDYMSDTINTGVYKCGFTQSQVMLEPLTCIQLALCFAANIVAAVDPFTQRMPQSAS